MKKIKTYKEVTVIELARKLGSGDVERGTVMGFRNDSRGDWTDAKISHIEIPNNCPFKVYRQTTLTEEEWACAALITERHPNEVPEGIAPLPHPWLAYIGKGPLPSGSVGRGNPELYWVSTYTTEWTGGGHGIDARAYYAVDVRTDYARKHYPELVDAMEYREPLRVTELDGSPASMPEAAIDTYTRLLVLLVDIRVAAGDPEGKLMQSELVEHIRNLRRERDEARAELAELRKDKARLDWLQALPKMVITKWALQETMQCEGYDADGREFCSEDPQLRQAIDAAMKEEVQP